ncbi:MAG: biopolymer transporter ExbD [Phycisphaerae bacterium]|nr:biopolymer transporter ExbD [Phycisphaerae bacterium]
MTSGNLDLEDAISWRQGMLATCHGTTQELLEQIEFGGVDDDVEVSLNRQSWQPIDQFPVFAEALDDAQVRRSPRPVGEVDVNLTPMIDVTFLLLLFFMLTATYEKQKSIDTPPPPSNSAARPTLQELQDENIVARVSADGTLQLDDDAVSWNHVGKELEKRRRERKTTSLIIVAEDMADWGLLVRLQDEAILAGIEKVAFGKGVPPGNE